VRLETLLPLGKVDPGLRAPDIPLDIWSVARDAALLEEIGYGGLVVEETKDDPFTLLALAAQATTGLRLGTSVTIAFPRSPTVMALSAWTLQKLSRGRFTLGLGTQVRGHIQRRYGVTWHPPAPWIREYTQAVRAVWDCWQNGTRLDFAGEHYRLSLMVPLFDAGPIEHPGIPIHLAAVNTGLCTVAGEVADGVRPHPVCTPSYIRSVMLPAVRRGAQKSGRSLDRFRVCMKPLVASARTQEALLPKVRDARARIAFYASTPGYVRAFEHHGLGDLAAEAQLLSKAQRWEELPGLIDDEVLHEFVTVGTYDEIGGKILQRYGDVVTDIEFSIAVQTSEDRETLGKLAGLLQEASDTPARATITGQGTGAAGLQALLVCRYRIGVIGQLVGLDSRLRRPGIGLDRRRIRHQGHAQDQLVARVLPGSEHWLIHTVRQRLVVGQVDARVLQAATQQSAQSVDVARGVLLPRLALVGQERAADGRGPGDVLFPPVQPDGVIGLHPRQDVRDEIRVVLAAERVKVESPLGEDDLLTCRA
jgi:probable F420-dependent oxidoreductase